MDQARIRILRQAAALLAAVALLGISQATPAAATTYEGSIVHVQSGKCLDGSVSQGVRLVTCDGSLYQEWVVDFSGAGAIKHVQSGKCLDGSVSQGVRLVTCDSGSFQQWNPKVAYAIKHVQSGKCLDGSVSQGVRLVTCDGGSFQQWTF
ncbi:hypothetical protein GCM10009759_04250 [Kitasatospora saccharophila]|uniref:Ricin B lectin domain-containing protein n=1 Tax=Kitasatospora saccharophila TaxID=407973 RepID=A0ABN2W796_9ACTN